MQYKITYLRFAKDSQRLLFRVVRLAREQVPNSDDIQATMRCTHLSHTSPPGSRFVGIIYLSFVCRFTTKCFLKCYIGICYLPFIWQNPFVCDYDMRCVFFLRALVVCGICIRGDPKKNRSLREFRNIFPSIGCSKLEEETILARRSQDGNLK